MVSLQQLESITFYIGEGESRSRMDASIFLHGVCGIFALALHDWFGYGIEHVVAPMEPEGEFEEEEDNAPVTTLVHIYCGSEGMLYDVRGGTSDESAFFEEFSDWIDGDEDYFAFDSKECRQFVRGCMTEAEYRQYYNAAIKIISEHKEWYEE